MQVALLLLRVGIVQVFFAGSQDVDSSYVHCLDV